ncbi:hypothetical protein [Actinoplanes couchii]|uniref:Membrane-associated oxidoreductase n=1 Tax=Actinoplanes couchii TaxID=403638 RepID=A0ABQ3XHN2_9ACTN|nr:hypothetical protein [Actinoplanes couchii]MDR6317612.1 hypothetical protein [Actinoplanes couchii]GID57996.1 hypothetical protein Aco03nite_064000 [Actinoplanes couchii]
MIALRSDEDFTRQLLAASRARRVLDCGGATVDAGELRAACLALGEADPFGLVVARALITGPLDLRAGEVPVALHFPSCVFTDPVDVSGAVLHELGITGSVLPGLLAAGTRITRDLDLSGTRITGDVPAPANVWLTEAHIGGSLIARDTRILPSAGRALQADRIRVGGNVRLLDGFRATGEVRFLAMHLDGALDVIGAEFAPADGRALDLSEADIGGSVYLLQSPGTGRRCRVRGRIEMGHATIRGELFVRDADLTAPPAGDGVHFYNVASTVDRILLMAPRLTVHGTLRIEGDTVARGGILLPGARLDGGVKLAGAVWNPHDTALDLTQATLGGGIDASEVSFEGTVRLDNASVGGPVFLRDTTLLRPAGRRCLSAVNLTTTGDVHLRGLAAIGGRLDFRGASITGVFDAEDAYLTNPGDKTISLHMAHVTGNVRMCGRFRSVGQVGLHRAVIGGRLRADGATLTSHDGNAAVFEAISAEIRGGVDLGWHVTAGTVDFTGTTTSYLADRPDRDWPAGSFAGGFVYDRFESVNRHSDPITDPGTRIAWLARMGQYEPRAWEQLAVVLRAAGDNDGADDVLVAKRRRARRLRPAPMRVLDLLQDVTVRYGFRPQRAVYLLMTLIATVTVALSLPDVQAQMRATDQNALVFTTSGAQPLPGEHDPPGDCGNGRVRCLSPFFYAVDTVVPLIDLHQRSTWYPVTERGGLLLEILLNLCTVLGWVTSTVFALSFTRLGRAG